MDAKERAKFINSVSSASPRPAEPQPATNTQENKKMEIQPEYQEGVFAAGLPDWDILPPQVVVRRKRQI